MAVHCCTGWCWHWQRGWRQRVCHWCWNHASAGVGTFVGLHTTLLVDACPSMAVHCLHHTGVGLGVFIDWHIHCSDVGSFVVFVEVVDKPYSCGGVVSGLRTRQDGGVIVAVACLLALTLSLVQL